MFLLKYQAILGGTVRLSTRLSGSTLLNNDSSVFVRMHLLFFVFFFSISEVLLKQTVSVLLFSFPKLEEETKGKIGMKPSKEEVKSLLLKIFRKYHQLNSFELCDLLNELCNLFKKGLNFVCYCIYLIEIYLGNLQLPKNLSLSLINSQLLIYLCLQLFTIT